MLDPWRLWTRDDLCWLVRYRSPRLFIHLERRLHTALAESPLHHRQIGTHDLGQIRTARQLERVQVAEMGVAIIPPRDDEARVVQYGDICSAIIWVSM